ATARLPAVLPRSVVSSARGTPAGRWWTARDTCSRPCSRRSRAAPSRAVSRFRTRSCAPGWRRRSRATGRSAQGTAPVDAAAPGATLRELMPAKTLVIAEKPSVGRDLVSVLPGGFTKGEGYLEGPEHIVTWAVGLLVQLADPDEYDEKFKKWKMADLPIVPDRFKLVVRDERSKKQMNAIKRQLGRDDVELVVNACDAGRE